MPLFWVLFAVLSDFWAPFWAIPGFLGIIFLVKFDFFRNNPDFWYIDSDILLMTLWNAACRALVSYLLKSDLTCSCKKEWQ